MSYALTQKQRLANILAEVESEGYVLPARPQMRADCKVLVKQGRLVPNGCLGYKLPETKEI